MSNIGRVSINALGSNTGMPYIGDIRFKKLLKVRELIAVEQERDRIQNFSKTSSPDLAVMAETLAYLSQRIVIDEETPLWWKTSNNGKELEDFSVAFELYLKIEEAIKEHTDEIKKRLDEAKKGS